MDSAIAVSPASAHALALSALRGHVTVLRREIVDVERKIQELEDAWERAAESLSTEALQDSLVKPRA